MKWLLSWIDFPENHLDVEFLHVLGVNESVWQIGRVLFLCARLGRRRGTIMAKGDEQIELKFRIYDGTDIGHSTYASSMTVATLKQRLVAQWPQDKTVTPKSINDVKLIHGGKVLENNKSLFDSVLPFGDLPGGVITMHVVIQPPVAKKKTDKSQEKLNSCSCVIL